MSDYCLPGPCPASPGNRVCPSCYKDSLKNRLPTNQLISCLVAFSLLQPHTCTQPLSIRPRGFPWQAGNVPRDKVDFPGWALSPSFFWVPGPLLSLPHLGDHHYLPAGSVRRRSEEDVDSVRPPNSVEFIRNSFGIHSVRPLAGLLGSGASFLHLTVPTQLAETQEVDDGGNDSNNDNGNNTLEPTKWLRNTL